MASFSIPPLHDNVDGWGPASDSVPEHLKYLVWRSPCPPCPVRFCLVLFQHVLLHRRADGVLPRAPQPFAPFSKSDRVGRACEWNFTRDRERNRHWQRNVGFGKEGEPSPFVMEQVDEEGFHLVEQKTPAKPKWGPGARGGRGGMRGGMRWVQMT